MAQNRSPNLGMIDDISTIFNYNTSLELFRRMSLSRYFEGKCAEIYDTGIIKCPIYLSTGQEAIASALSIGLPDVAIFPQHRCHDLYISYACNRPELFDQLVIKLIDEILGRSTGCAGGMGGSASIHSPEMKIYGHDGLMGTQVPIAVGHALATGQMTITIMGDASAEEDYVLGAIGFAATQKAPILFICSDNNLSCLTPIPVRRNWSMIECGSFGMKSIEITDNPWLILHKIYYEELESPTFINIQTCRIASHANTNKDRVSIPEWNRYALVKEELGKLGLLEEAIEIEQLSKKLIDKLWTSRLEVK